MYLLRVLVVVRVDVVEGSSVPSCCARAISLGTSSFRPPWASLSYTNDIVDLHGLTSLYSSSRHSLFPAEIPDLWTIRIARFRRGYPASCAVHPYH